jgi:hypothetical protein
LADSLCRDVERRAKGSIYLQLARGLQGTADLGIVTFEEMVSPEVFAKMFGILIDLRATADNYKDYWELFAQTPRWTRHVPIGRLLDCLGGPGVGGTLSISKLQGSCGRVVRLDETRDAVLSLTCTSLRLKALRNVFDHEQCSRCKFIGHQDLTGRDGCLTAHDVDCPALHNARNAPVPPSWRLRLTLHWTAGIQDPGLAL